jgi:ATP-binding cassette subfamily B protein
MSESSNKPAAPVRGPGGFGGPGGPGGPGRGRGPGGGMFGGGHGMAGGGAKAKNFAASFRRLLGQLKPETGKIVAVMFLAIVSVAFAVAAPKILGNATNQLFSGVIGKMVGQQMGGNVPAGLTKDQVVTAMRAKVTAAQAAANALPAGPAHDSAVTAANQASQQLDMLSNMDFTPGVGVDFTAVGMIIFILIGVYVMSAAFSWGQQYIMAGVSQRTVYKMRQEIDLKIARLPLKYFDSHERGDLLSRVTNDIDNIANSLQQSLTQLISAIFTIIGVLGMMFWISWELALISLLVLPIALVGTIQIAKRSQKQFTEQWKQTGDLNGVVEEMHTGHSIVKIFGRQKEVIETFDGLNQKMYEASFKAQFISGIIQPMMNFIGNLNYVAIAVIGGVKVASGTMSLGDVQAFIQYSRQFTMPITQTASIANVFQSAVASAERVFEMLDEAEELPDTATPITLEHPTGRVTLEDVSFRYEPETPLIEDFSLDVKPGQTVAIVGPTGAGKTTIVNLLMRFYEIDHGRIALDGIDIRDMTRDNLRTTFGMVLQDAWLFGGTIRENIEYGLDGATEETMLAAAQAAYVDHFVRTLPDGYDTMLDDDASNISAGEKQLLTIARAFLADPEILILDEATSSVDTRTEVLIQKAMKRLMHGRTSFVIAHRLSTIRDADTIIVMNHGRIVEQGNHEELLAAKGFYFDLYNSQFVEAFDEAV